MKTELERLKWVLEELKEDERPKLVEGKKDEDAFLYFGISNIAKVQTQPLVDTIARLNGSAIILTDMDEAGDELTVNLIRLLTGEGVPFDLSYRDKMRSFGVYRMENLISAYHKLEEDANGKDLHRYSEVYRLRELGDRRNR